METWSLDSLHSGGFLRLQNHLTHKTGFQLHISEFNNILYRDSVIRHIARTFKTNTLLLDERIIDFEEFKRNLQSNAKEYQVLHILNLEIWLADLNTRNRRFEGFNYYREELAEHCSLALMLWMTKADIMYFALKAPDLWAWRTQVYDFSWQIKQDKTPIIGLGMADENISPQVVRALIKKAKNNIKSLPNYLCEDAAIYWQNIGDLYRKIGDNKKALSAFEEASSIFEAMDDKRRSHLTLRSMIDIKASLEITEETFKNYIISLRIFETLGDIEQQRESLQKIVCSLVKRNSTIDRWKVTEISNLINQKMLATAQHIQEIIQMNTFKLRLLHISDLHERGPAESEIWRRRRVLGDNWLENLNYLKTKGPFDLVCFTGDIAHSGQESEYTAATGFIQEILRILHVPLEHLFLVPGNHDICHITEKDNWEKLRATLNRINDQDFSRWLVGNPNTPLGLQDGQRDALLARQAAYRDWLRNDLRRFNLLPDPTIHPHLGYRQTVSIPGLPFAIHIIGLDSAWLAGDGKQHNTGKLRLTEDQVMRLTSDSNGDPLSGLRLALIHHPLTELADGAHCQRLLAERVDLLLRGHLHEPEPAEWADPERRLRQVAAGCLYEGHKADHYPNACEVIEIDLDDNGRPQQYNLWFRGWSEKGFWFDDNSLYRQTKEGRLNWTV
jgi:calcineurin-like phosphoesterase family protein